MGTHCGGEHGRDTEYGQILEVFFRRHDPTTADRQGPDVGTVRTEYRSASEGNQRLGAEAVEEPHHDADYSCGGVA
jgi:peptide methionine sulfoxide reductase MsrA